MGQFFLIQTKSKQRGQICSEEKLKATFTFEGNPIEVGDKFLACLVAVDGGVEIENATFKIQKNSPQNKPEVVNFQRNTIFDQPS